MYDVDVEENRNKEYFRIRAALYMLASKMKLRNISWGKDKVKE